MKLKLSKLGVLLGVPAIVGGFAAAGQPDQPLVFADQGREWTPQLRAALYVQDQGSQLIPLAWFEALTQADGKPFTEGALARFGFLPNPQAAHGDRLPVGFSLADSQQGPMVGMTCAACHTRDIKAAGVTYRIDGGPAFADFQSFVLDLDAAVRRALASDSSFKSFAEGVLGGEAAKPAAVMALHDSVALWSLRFHTWVGQIPTDRPWGPSRLDAIAMIYNRVNGLDLGPAPTYMLADNMAIADAPTRYPFLWNAGRQDKTQWGAWAANGNEGLAVARNLGQVFGVFATFHPGPKTSATPLDHDYLSTNSSNIPGIAAAETILARLGPPVWPFPVDHALAERGREIFNRPAAQGGCVECHGVAEGEPRPPNAHSWRTVSLDAGTDLHQWQIVLRSARTGMLEGATVPGVVGPLQATDLSLNILKAAVTGTIAELQAAQAAAAQAAAPAAAPPEAKAKDDQAKADAAKGGMTAPDATVPMTHEDMQNTMQVPDMPPKVQKTADEKPADPAAHPPGTFVYEARVLQGIWAAAPYLHNGSVPSLTELLKPAGQRVKSFKIGPAYDTQAVGLAPDQAGNFTLVTTGCEDRMSGNSNCGHEYGTQLPEDEKKALLEYLKVL
ncbi:di-heme-cytochrome C peroxidase [Methyloferula stellata]|uniref:di-heme-cytochrome C peroxidase n=1 Tax=Methyloferula stellata TaxID=876270 RepID=UPI00039E4611|nr:di-heme-cytochrome C peroxidase [Methyloferula stellata]